MSVEKVLCGEVGYEGEAKWHGKVKNPVSKLNFVKWVGFKFGFC